MAEDCGGYDLGFDLNLIPHSENTEFRSEKLWGPNLERNDVENHEEDKDGKGTDTAGTRGGFDRGFDLNLTPEVNLNPVVNLTPEVENTDIIPKRKRGRKRKRIDVQNVEVQKDGEKRVIRTRGKALVGRYVRKEFVGSGVFLGKIVFYDSGLYRVDFEDGDYQDLELSKVKSILIQETDINGEWLERKKKLDVLVSSQGAKLKGDLKVEEMLPLKPSKVVADALVDFKAENGVSADSVEVFGNDRVPAIVSEVSLEGEVPSVPQPELPPSSGTVGIPEEYVSHLFSVYSFLRSFSIQLFLSPFTLDDFVGSLNCAVPNALLDSIHVALMRALRRHIEKLSSEGSELASKCIRGVDWSLLDTLTWPVYLVHYLSAMGYSDGPEWKGFYTHVLKEDYYTLTVGRKLAILQILCDDVLDTKELRAEVDMREELEVGMDSETGIVVTPINRPKRVHPRKSKTSACKDPEVTEFIVQNHEMKSYYNSDQSISKDHGQDSSSDVDQDSNGDDCRLCGMDGILLCCDGCPASYHARCIGVCKVFMPEGAWYCPECSIKKTGPKVTKGTSLKGVDVLGIDAYGQAFVATCGHLLVLNASMNSDSCLRYYNPNDIPNVLQALQSNEQHISIYSEVCKGIIKYWELPADIFSHCGTSVIGEQKEVAKSALTVSLILLGTEGHSISEMTESEETLSCVTGSSLGTITHANISLSAAMNLDHGGQGGNEGATEEQGVPPLKTFIPQEIRVKSNTFSGPLSDHADPSDVKEKEKPSVAITTRISRDISGYANEHSNSPAVVAKEAIQRRETNGDRGHQNCFLYMGSSFKSQGYINNYLHGDFAAAAAANVTNLSSEENLVSESQASDLRKLISANYSLQIKAFSLVATRFFWPHTEKKLIEVPRERCTWCLSCKAPVVSKRGCLLNAAASNAIKSAIKILAGLRPLKSGEGTLPSIATYIMLMEESLSGLTVGPFQAAAFRKRWRRKLEQANTLSALKILLLELEENIRPIALSGDWLKLVDGWSAESSVIQNSIAAVGSTQKRKPGKRSRKPSITSEVNAHGGRDTSGDFTWRRGSMLSMLIFQKGSLPRSLVKKAARQGGSRKIPGTNYAEGSETPKISRQLVWRAAVEMSRNLSQLALQVRYLDFHIRWNDLVRPELSVQDSKAFRNACICNKKIVENEIRYSIAFGGQKQPPSRVMKNITEVEKLHHGEEIYWFPETRIPLYLIKEYEESAKKVIFPSAKKPANAVAKLRRSPLRASHKDIFSYLARKRDEKEIARKRDKMEKHHFGVCRLEVLLGVCEGKNLRKTRLLTRRRSVVKCWCSVCLGKNLRKRRQLRRRRSERSEKNGARSKGAGTSSKRIGTRSKGFGQKSKRKR